MREISTEQLKEILSKHELWLDSSGNKGEQADLQEVDLRGANLRGSNLRRANLYEVDLREVDLREVDLQGAMNIEHAFVDQAQRAILGLTDDTVTQLQQQIKHAEQAIQEKKELKRKIQQLEDNTQNQKDKQIEIDKLEEKLEEKTAEAEQVALLKIKLKNATVQRDESQDKELEDAIEKISNSNKDGSDTLKTYKKNSTFLMQFGIILFFSAILIAGYIYYSKIFSVDISNLSSFHLVLFSPSFVLAFAGTALLRHDWKIRQLTQQLITQNNHIDIATGILTASLNLTRIDNIEKEELSLLRDSFTSVRQALLFKENTSSNNTNNQESLDKEGELSASIKTLSRYIKNI